MGVRISRNGKLAFVALGPANRVAVIDTATFKVEKYLLVGQRVWQLAFTPDDKLLFTTSGASNDVSVIDVEKLRVLRSIRVGRYPCRVWWWPGIERAPSIAAPTPSQEETCLVGSAAVSLAPRSWPRPESRSRHAMSLRSRWSGRRR